MTTLNRSAPPVPGAHNTSSNGRGNVCGATISPIPSSGTVMTAIETIGDPYLIGPLRGEKENASIAEQRVLPERGRSAHVDLRPIVNASIMGQNVSLDWAKNARADLCPRTLGWTVHDTMVTRAYEAKTSCRLPRSAQRAHLRQPTPRRRCNLDLQEYETLSRGL